MPTTPRLVPRSEALGGVGVFTVVTGGMVLLSSFGMVFSSGACGLHRRKVCPDRSLHVLVGFMSGAVLTGLGVTLIKSGYRKVPAWTNPTARLSPWVGPKQGGLALQLDL